MSDSNGARIPLVERDDVPPEYLEAYDHVGAARGGAGTMGNVFKALANSPLILEKVAAVGEVLREVGLDRKLQEFTILTVAHETKCEYEWGGHYRFAERALKVPPEELQTIGTPAAEQLPAPLGPAMRFTRLVTHGEEVDDETIETLRSSLGNKGLMELTVTAGYYLLLSRMLMTFRVPVEQREPRPAGSQ